MLGTQKLPTTHDYMHMLSTSATANLNLEAATMVQPFVMDARTTTTSGTADPNPS